MNTVASLESDPHAPQLIEWIDFKWLMATEGHRVDVDRLQREAAYAARCLDLALASPSALLHQVATRLRGRLPA
jgi:hypothetical protein